LGRAFVFIVVFDQRIDHVDPETIAALFEPEPHDVLEGFPGGGAGGVIRWNTGYSRISG
jgi:hypothetical protein